MKLNYCFANHIFEIETAFPYFHDFAKEYLTEEKPEFTLKTTKEEVEEWKSSHKDCDGFNLDYIETLVLHAKIASVLSLFDAFILHGSTIYVDEPKNAFVFTAPSGTGKSTHVSILRKVYGNRINIINDDKPFLSYNSKDNTFDVFGSPWNGKERLSNNISGSLKGIFVVKQAKTNKVSKLSPDEAVSKLITQLYMPKGMEESKHSLKALASLVKCIPIYILEVNMSEEAGNTSFEVMLKLIEESK